MEGIPLGCGRRESSCNRVEYKVAAGMNPTRRRHCGAESATTLNQR